MIIQVNSDSNIESGEALTEQFKAEVENRLAHFGGQVTRVEVHLSDENSDKKGGAEDMRCLIEARLAGLQPLTASHRAATLQLAVDGAVDKLVRAIDTTRGKLDDQLK